MLLSSHGKASSPLFVIPGATLAADQVLTRFTRVALDGAAELGFDTKTMREVVMGLSREDFYKSMTTYDDATVWQDVYRPTADGVSL